MTAFTRKRTTDLTPGHAIADGYNAMVTFLHQQGEDLSGGLWVSDGCTTRHWNVTFENGVLIAMYIAQKYIMPYEQEPRGDWKHWEPDRIEGGSDE